MYGRTRRVLPGRAGSAYQKGFSAVISVCSSFSKCIMYGRECIRAATLLLPVAG